VGAIPSAAPSTPRSRAERRLGTTLDGKYRLDAVLGVGGMAVVYRAVHRNGNRVAIKMLHAEISADPDLRARFVREGYVANAIENAGSVRVLDDDVTEDGAAFLVMELLEGETLVDRATRLGGRLPREEVVAIAQRLLGVLVAAHAAGVVHRDIKPENVFLTTEGALKVLDFGIARMSDLKGSGSTRTGRVMGTPAFMPPEQALGRSKEIDERSDLWAVGATMFNLLTGRYVHDAETPEEQVVKTATQPVRPVAEVLPELPREVGAVIDRALAYDKRDRFASAKEMAEALEGATAQAFPAPPSLPRGLPQGAGHESIGHARTVDASSPEIVVGSPSPVRPFDTVDGDAAAARRVSTKKSVPPPGSRKIAPAWVALAGAAVLVAGVLAARGRLSTSTPTATAPSTPTAPCRSNAECAGDGSVPALCRKETGSCVPVLTKDCNQVLAEKGDVANDATIWIGAMIPRHGPDGSRVGAEVVNTLDLARRDFIAISDGVPGATAGAPAHPLAIVLCDDLDDSAGCAHHLIDELGVPAVIGFGKTKAVMDLVPSLFNPTRTLAVVALNTSPILTSVPRASDGTRFMWRVTSDVEVSARTVAAFAERDVVPLLPKGERGETLRVAVARSDNPGMLAVADSLVSRLRQSTGADITMARVDPEHSEEDEKKVASQVLSSQPQLVVLIGGATAWVGNVIRQVERDWPRGKPRPRYMTFSTGVLAQVSAIAAASPEARSRILAIDSPALVPANVSLALHYSETFTPLTPESTFGPVYDAVYFLAYASIAVGNAPVTGESLSHALARLQPPGEPIAVGPTSILAATNALRAGKNIDLIGSTTTLDLDPATGDSAADAEIFCLKATPDRRGVEVRGSGVIFDAKTQKLTGKLDCP
jgi:serine/threonine-protein kinase